MRRRTLLAIPVALLALASAASAQDFGRAWIDRITHEVIEEEGPLSPHPVEVKVSGGVVYSYDSNIFLEHSNTSSDSIIIPFAAAGIKYAQPTFDLEADAIVNYNAYMSNSDSDGDEERLFLRGRFQGTKVGISIVEIIRHETSPTDVVFTSRVPRFLSDTIPLFTVKFSEIVGIEVTSTIEVVRYLNSAFSSADNTNTRTLFTLVYTDSGSGIDFLVQGGYSTIGYTSNTSTQADAAGFIARVGARGEISPNLHLIALVGYTSIDSDVSPVTGSDFTNATSDIEIHLSYTASETTTIWADYSRRFGFSVGISPFEVVDIAGLSGEVKVNDKLKLRGRAAYSRAHEAVGTRRAYYDIGAGANYQFHAHIMGDAGVTYRWGVTPGASQSANFTDFIATLGVAFVW